MWTRELEAWLLSESSDAVLANLAQGEIRYLYLYQLAKSADENQILAGSAVVFAGPRLGCCWRVFLSRITVSVMPSSGTRICVGHILIQKYLQDMVMCGRNRIKAQTITRIHVPDSKFAPRVAMKPDRHFTSVSVVGVV